MGASREAREAVGKGGWSFDGPFVQWAWQKRQDAAKTKVHGGHKAMDSGVNFPVQFGWGCGGRGALSWQAVQAVQGAHAQRPSADGEWKG